MNRTVSTGDLGLDVLLGGGWHLVTRLPGLASATVVVRGGAGAGKTLMGLQVAIELARALDGDIAVACVEILPTEYAAQIRSARSSLTESRVVVMPASVSDRPADVATSTDHPRVYIGLLTDLDPDEPDLVASLETLERDVTREGGKPVVFIVDSLIEGYGIGANAPRPTADALMKFAAQGGRGLVLCEEQINEHPSPWVFAADTVLQLGVESRPRGRWIEVRKHRFGPSATGRHELDLAGPEHPEAFPEPHSWTTPALGSVLAAHGWVFEQHRGAASALWLEAAGTRGNPIPLEGALIFVAADSSEVARSVAYALRPVHGPWSRQYSIEFDPLLVEQDVDIGFERDVAYVPTMHGAARALRQLVDSFARIHDVRNVDRAVSVVLGDVGLVVSAPDAPQWIEALRVFAAVLVESGLGAKLIVYASVTRGPNEATSQLATQADVLIQLSATSSIVDATISTRWPRGSHSLEWDRATLRRALGDLDGSSAVRGERAHAAPKE